jgi:ribose transport system permease protein
MTEKETCSREKIHRSVRITQEGIVLMVFVAMFAGFAVALPNFLTVGNLIGLLQNVAILGILGLGMAVVVIGRGIDLSMIAALAVPAGLLLQLVQDGHPLAGSLLLVLALSVAFGLFNGWLVAYLEVPPLFATLASGLLLAGAGQVAFFRFDVVQWTSGMEPLAWMGRATVAGIPVPVMLFALATLITWWGLSRTRAGLFLYATGDNATTARTTGIPVRPLVLAQYVYAAMVGCFAGLVMAASVNSMPTRIFSSTLIYDVILVVVLGGIGLSGGKGGVSNVVVGTLLIGTMLNGMTILDLSYSAQNFVKGVVLLLAVVADSLINPRSEEISQQGDI